MVERVLGITRVDPGNRFVEFSRDETEQSIAERFEKLARRNPHRIAVQTGRLQVTYDELNKSANRLARALLRQSRDNRPVAILMEHDAPAVVAIFGALKASRIFVLLDPALPDTRIGQILTDSGANLIVTNDPSFGTASELRDSSRSIVNLDRFDGELNSDNVDLKISPNRIAYILYTSGSTGRPKGVIRTHRNDLQNIRNRTNTYCISDDDRITLLGSYSTGQGMTDICAALLNGATLFSRNLKAEGFSGLAVWLMRERITIYHSAATLFRRFVGDLGSRMVFPALRVVNIGGEPVSWKDVELYRKHFSENCILANEISCSEASTFGQFLLNKQTEIGVTVPVGYPVEGKEVLILDEKGERLAAGAVGEIAICSDFLFPGYWNRPDLTESALSPVRGSQALRMYRTGDLGRISADGCLEYLGRKDTRVKIRGYRVESYEVELALLENPAVNQAFVTHRQDGRDESYLVAYIVCEKGGLLTVSGLRAALSARLPEYMVPSAFVFIDTLPLTPAGKIDRRALPEPAAARPPLDVSYVAPRGPVEESVASLCSQILNIGVIGVHDNLFDLGGSSLSAMQIVAQVMKTFRVNVPLKWFYESPTIAGLSAIITTSRRSTETSEDTVLWQDLPEGHLPLSYLQERLWFMEQWEAGKPTYNLCQAYRLKGPLNVRAMEESFNVVVDRHEILRTSFGADDGRPSQIIAPVLRLSLPILDLRTVPEAEKNATSLQLAQEEARRSFDLTQGPLLRVLLVRLADEEHLLVLTVHQMVCDGWSVRILLSEFWTSYEAICRDQSPSLPTLSAQYSDFAIWQRQLLNDDWLQSQIAFWQETLKGTLAVLALPTGHPRPPVESFRGSRALFVLPETLTKSLNDLARQEEVTLFMTLMAAFKILLYRYNGQEDSIVGFSIANRRWGEATGLIGFFVNTLVARTAVSGGLTLRDFLLRVKDVCYAAYANQDLPFEKLVEVLRPLRDLSRNPVFQAMFTFQNMPLTYAVPPELSSTLISIDNGTSKVDLTLSLAERNSHLNGFFEYSTDLFDRITIERMAGHFQTLLEGIVADPDQAISSLPLLTEAERYQLLVEWNDTAAGFPKDSRIHELFEAQVERTPDAVAVEFEGKSLTYRELNARANQIAHYLRGLGVGAEELVGICAERSFEMVIGLLGILKSGAAYVPLDPDYPKERLAFMVEDARISVLLTEERLIEDRRSRPVLREAEGIEDSGDPPFSVFDPHVRLVCLDRDWQTIAQKSAENPGRAADADNLAYVIYTSGSTGKPKGIQVSHQSIVNCIHSIRPHVGLTESDVFLAVTTISFDIATLELYLPLMTGAKIILAGQDDARDSEQLLEKLTKCGVTAMQATPSTWQLLVDAGWQGNESFKILCGGEALPRRLADELLGRGSLWNLYGPTETTIWSTIYRVQPGEGPVPIGRSIENTQLYILDSHLQPVPIGVHGELCIGGNGLARGYWNQPELTAEKFIPNPFEAGERLYKTGDRARFRPDGNIEFIGRIDNQVKIRGYRLELGEIEATLNQHPAVKDSMLLARAFGSLTEHALVAYVVPNQQAAPSISELRDHLKEKLPEYMIPSVFVMLDSLPLTPSGKVDRNALPAADGTRPNPAHESVGPRTEIEDLVAQVWREVLKLDRIGVHDNFFELGGHSLLATRVVARLRNNFSIDLALRKLFELPTVAALAEHIDGLLHLQSGTTAPPIVPVPRDRVPPASFSQQRLWFLRELDPESTAYNISAVFAIRGVLDVPALEEAFNAIVARHEILRTTFDVREGTLVQTIQSSLRICLPIVDFGSLSENMWGAAAREVALDEARQPFDLRKGPLLRVKLLQSSEERYYLLLDFDHAVLDGWSMGTFFKELGVLYGAFAGGQPNPLPPLPLQYADYAVWQRECFHGDVSESQLEYWKRQLGDRLTPLSLPTDYPRPPLQTSRGIRKTLGLSKQLSDSLKELSRREGVTLFMTLLAGFKILFSRHGGQDDIVIGATIAGRSRPEIEGLIGFFINALPLRTDLSGSPSFLELLKRVREVCLGAYTHQDAPFEKIVEAINPRRDFSRNPLFQIMFNMADVSERVLQLVCCEVKKESFFDPEAKFDITLYAPEKDGVIELAMVYNADLFVESRMTAMLDQFAYLLAQITEKPQARIGEYSLVLPPMRELLPDPTESLDDRWEGAIHELFSERARITPEKLAVLDPDDTWTYRDLDQRSAQLANYLVANGIRPKDIVAIYAHRSSPLVLALLGVLRAGAVFVILDPAYPPARLLAYLSIARPKGWIQIDAAGKIPEELADYLETIDLSCRLSLSRKKPALAHLLIKQPEAETHVVIAANDPAYVAFTSGSTGQPKGVLSRHGPITHFLPWQTEAFDLGETDRFCLLSGLAYNHLHRDVFTPLALGATLYVPPGEVARDPERLTKWLRANSISVMHLTPSLGQLLLTAGMQPLPAVRRVFFGGDVLTVGLIAELRRVLPNAIIGSFYGATETQRAVGYYEIPAGYATNSGGANRPLPLGRGIKDVQLLLLNKVGHLAGVGELGELYVRSPHLAEGYLGDQKLTNEKFITNPFTNDPNDRLYHTGELGRYLPDGNVEWAGRNDRRVNIRGFRVELQEIEAVLKQHPAVQNAAVAVQDHEISTPENPRPETRNPKLGQRLVAYIAAEEVQQSLADLLHGYLSSRLPDYMVPAHFVILEKLPLSPNGKVDYRELPPVQQFLLIPSSPMQSPRNEVEAKLSVIFSQVLGRDQVGIEENFFRLGGHSLLAAQTAARIRESFGVSLELRTFLESPTIAALAKEIEIRIRAVDTTPSTRDTDREEIEL